MSRKIWLALAVVALVAASFAASVVAAKRAADPRTKYTTHALDYLHSRQTDNGGFSTPENTAWAILGVVAKRERQGASAWRVKGKNPFMYLQSSDLAAAASNGAENAPVYYSRLIMAYVASRNEQPGSDRRQQEHQPARRAEESTRTCRPGPTRARSRRSPAP